MYRFISNMFRRHKMSFGLNILGLSLAFTTFYLLMTQVTFEWGFDSFHKDAKRIYRLEHMWGDEFSQHFSFPSLYHLMESNPQIEAGAIRTGYRGGYIMMPDDTTGTKWVSTSFCYVTKGFTDVFTFDLVEGSLDSIQNPECALIPLSLAEKLYGKQTSYLGKIFGDNVSWFLRIGGVYRDFPKNSMLRNIVYQVPNEGWFNNYMNSWDELSYFGYIKLNKQVDPKLFEKNIKINCPDNTRNFSETIFKLTSLKDIYYDSNSGDTNITGNRNINRLLFSIAVLIIIIAGINFMNFSMALVPTKIKSINTQLVLGASAFRLRMSMVAEAIFAALLAYMLSLLIIYLISRTWMASFVDADIALQQQWGLVAGTLLVAVVSGFLSGIYPAYYITSFPPARVINGSFSLSVKGRLLRNTLIGLQFTISLLVIMVVIFMHLQNSYMRTQSPGFDKDQIVYVGLSKLREMSDALVSKLKENPHIEEVAFTGNFIGSSDSYMKWGRMTEKDENITFDVIEVTPDYLKTLGITVTEGRDFRPEDERSTYGSFIFNEAAKKRFNLEIGDVIEKNGTIIGFMPDIKYQSFRKEVGPMAFYVWGTENWGLRTYGMTVRIKAGADMIKTMDYIGSVCKELDPDFHDGNVGQYNDMLKYLYQREQQQYTLVSIFSLLIIFISIVGVFGLVIFETQTRRREIGVCKVFGSSIWQVLYLFNKTYIQIVLICAVIAIPIAYRIIEVWLQNFAYHISIQVWVFALALLIVLAIVILTVTIQSWRAANANPVDSLKNN